MKYVFGNPTPDSVRRDGSNGISQVVLNLEKTLPKHAYKLVSNQNGARLTAHHAGSGHGDTDVAFCHGLYPTGMPAFKHGKLHDEINRRVMLDIVSAKEVIVPSQWVGNVIRKEFGIVPHVINWGVDLKQWENDAKHDGFILWNKNRVDGVCSPAPMNKLASMAENFHFKSTFGDTAPNVQITGAMSFEDMKSTIKRAAVYLATTPETGDIGSREALAAGVPVLGFRHGAIVDFVQHGVNGFLAEVGDYDGLLKGLTFIMDNRDKLRSNALKLSKRYKWTSVATKVARVFDLALRQPSKTRVSIIIPCYNYEQYVGRAIQSALSQETNIDYEVIVVDDGSTDDSVGVIQEFRGITFIQQKNQGVAHARNNGIKHANGDYIICLDADDMIKPRFLQSCFDAMERDKTLGIAYTSLELERDGRISSWPAKYDKDNHLKGINQVPTCCMFRKEAWSRTFGFIQKFHPAEDARFWTDILELGYQAEKITEAPLFIYNIHNNSATHDEKGLVKEIPMYMHGKGWMASTDYPVAFGGGIKNCDPPLVSFIIPVGVGHEKYLPDALDSIKGQSLKEWEVLVINDTGEPLNLPAWAIEYKTKGKKGASVARNIGLKNARGKFVTFLDADDMVCPTFIEETHAAYRTHGGYVYTDCYTKKDGQQPIISRSFDFEPQRVFVHGFQNFITCLIPAEEAKKCKFDEKMKTWEDLDFYMQLIKNGCCGKRVPNPLFIYRLHTGNLRELGATWQEDLKDFLGERYKEYIHGGKEVACSCLERKPATIESEQVRIEYSPQNVTGGITAGRHTIKGFITGQHYGRRQKGDVFMMYKDDVLVNTALYVPITEIIEPAPRTLIPDGVKRL